VGLARRTLRPRPATMIATFLALWFAVVVATACGAMLDSGLRDHGPAQRYAATPVLVANGRQFVIAVSSAFGGSALLIALLAIVSTVGLSVTQRRREIALRGALAATPRQVRRMVVRETLVLGMLAAALGVWPGLAGAAWARDQLVSRGMVPDSFHVHLSSLPPLVASSVAVLIAVVAAGCASREPAASVPSRRGPRPRSSLPTSLRSATASCSEPPRP
jgi:putative ABC transport system permease protein